MVFVNNHSKTLRAPGAPLARGPQRRDPAALRVGLADPGGTRLPMFDHGFRPVVAGFVTGSWARRPDR
jgi:hypothetical protein